MLQKVWNQKYESNFPSPILNQLSSVPNFCCSFPICFFFHGNNPDPVSPYPSSSIAQYSFFSVSKKVHKISPGLPYAPSPILNPQSSIPNSLIRSAKKLQKVTFIPSFKFKSPICNPQSTILNPQSSIANFLIRSSLRFRETNPVPAGDTPFSNPQSPALLHPSPNVFPKDLEIAKHPGAERREGRG